MIQIFALPVHVVAVAILFAHKTPGELCLQRTAALGPSFGLYRRIRAQSRALECGLSVAAHMFAKHQLPCLGEFQVPGLYAIRRCRSENRGLTYTCRPGLDADARSVLCVDLCSLTLHAVLC